MSIYRVCAVVRRVCMPGLSFFAFFLLLECEGLAVVVVVGVRAGNEVYFSDFFVADRCVCSGFVGLRWSGAGSWMRVDSVRVGRGFECAGGGEGGEEEDEVMVVVNMFAIGVGDCGVGGSWRVRGVCVGSLPGLSLAFWRVGKGNCIAVVGLDGLGRVVVVRTIGRLGSEHKKEVEDRMKMLNLMAITIYGMPTNGYFNTHFKIEKRTTNHQLPQLYIYTLVPPTSSHSPTQATLSHQIYLDSSSKTCSWRS